MEAETLPRGLIRLPVWERLPAPLGPRGPTGDALRLSRPGPLVSSNWRSKLTSATREARRAWAPPPAPPLRLLPQNLHKSQRVDKAGPQSPRPPQAHWAASGSRAGRGAWHPGHQKRVLPRCQQAVGTCRGNGEEPKEWPRPPSSSPRLLQGPRPGHWLQSETLLRPPCHLEEVL